MPIKKMSVALLAAAAAASLSPAAGEEDGGMTARIEVRGNYYRAGEPVEVRINLENLGEEPIPNPEGIHLTAGLELEVDGETAKPSGPPPLDPATQPRTFLPGSSIMQIVDLTQVFPAVKQAGSYMVRLRAGELVSEPVKVIVVPEYDPDLDYRAKLKTDYGEITMDLLESEAPFHVRNFVDLARQGYYDDTFFFLIAKGEMIIGGSPKNDGTGGVPWGLEPELGNLPVERGTIFSVRTSLYDNANQFAISVRRSPERDGKYTIFARVVEGDETLRALEDLATTGQNRAPFYQPMSEIFLRGVDIQTSRPGDAAPESGTSEDPTAGGR